MVEIKIENFDGEGGKKIVLWTVFPGGFVSTHHQEFQVELRAAAKTVDTTKGVSVITYRNSRGILRRDVYIDGVKVPSIDTIKGSKDVRPDFHEPLYTGGPCGIYICSNTNRTDCCFDSSGFRIREEFIEFKFNYCKDKLDEWTKNTLIGYAIRNPKEALQNTSEVFSSRYWYPASVKEAATIMRKYAKYYA